MIRACKLAIVASLVFVNSTPEAEVYLARAQWLINGAEATFAEYIAIRPERYGRNVIRWYRWPNRSPRLTGGHSQTPKSFPQTSARHSSRISRARSISGRVIVSGGVKVMIFPMVSLKFRPFERAA